MKLRVGNDASWSVMVSICFLTWAVSVRLVEAWAHRVVLLRCSPLLLRS